MKISNAPKPSNVIVAKTIAKKDSKSAYQWWRAPNQAQVAAELLSTAAFLKETQQYRYRQAAIYARLYGNMPLMSFIGSNMTKMDQTHGLPTDRPTFNIVQSVIDTKVARIGQSRPAPVFLTDNSDYKQRNVAKKLNNFILGEFYQTKAYEKAVRILRDASVEGTGCIKVFESPDHKVALERVLLTELFVDPSESIYGEPRQLYQLKLMDRKVLMENMDGKYRAIIEKAETAYPDNSSDSSKTVSDLVMVVEGWHLRSGKDAKDGRHTIACTSGIILDEDYEKDKFPFVFLHDTERMLGFWSQGAAERLMGTQLEINSLLFTMSKAIKLVGVPRIFVEEGSKVSSASFNDAVGSIVKYRGTKPIFEVAPCVPQEMYAQLQRLIDYGYQQEGVSAMQASSEKPAGLNSGEAIRSYDDISTDRMAILAKKYDTFFIDLAYAIMDLAVDIAKEQGSYQTVFPNKDGTRQIDLPDMSILKNPFIIQCFNESSLPRDPAGRKQTVIEYMQAGLMSIKEGRRLLQFPDLSQIEKLANAAEERIFQILDKIVEDGEYTPADPFIDIALATELTTEYINLYSSAKLEEEKMQMLRDFFTQVQAIKQQAMTPPTGAVAPGTPPNAPGASPAPQANPEAPPTSPMLPNAPGAK
jgi:hypothetical protein